MPEDEDKNQPAGEEDKGSRMDAAKAFFRAMYAGEEPAAGGATGGASPEAESRRVKELEQQCKDLEQRANEAENLYKRMAADFDNFRRRMERDREEFANAGVRKAVEAIIPALDDLDRALMYLTPETPADKVIESFQLVAARVISCLEQAGLKRLTTLGEQFDPRFHEPVQQIESTTHVDGSIMHELRGGYILGEKVIRPALVNVAANDAMPAPPPPPKDEAGKTGPPPKTTGEHKTVPPTEQARATGEQKAPAPQDSAAAPAPAAEKAQIDEESTKSAAKSTEPELTKATANVKKEPTDDGVFDLGNVDDF